MRGVLWIDGCDGVFDLTRVGDGIGALVDSISIHGNLHGMCLGYGRIGWETIDDVPQQRYVVGRCDAELHVNVVGRDQ